MKLIIYKDGSKAELYEQGDLVELTRTQYGLVDNHPGEWGVVCLKDPRDKARGFTGYTSFIYIQFAGVSTSKDSFQQCTSAYVADVRAIKRDDPRYINYFKKKA